jgi:hypothetical protein
MTDEWPSLLAPGNKIVPIIAFRRGFLVELPPRSSWLENVGNFAIRWCDFLTDGSLCEGRAGGGVFSDTLDIRESYALGSLATVFQTEVYAILACSDYCRSANISLALSSYTISSELLSLQDLSNNNRVKLFWVPGHCDIKGNEEADRLA